MKKMTAATRSERMLNEPISSIIPRLALPSIITMLITAIYNMADTYFVSQIGTAASGAVGVVFSAMSIIQALAFTIGMGSGANLSRALGRNDTDEADRLVTIGVFTAFGTGLVLAALSLVTIDPLVRFLGATETIAPYARDYASYVFLAAPFMMSSLVMNNLLRFQGLATYSMIGMTAGGLLNIALDPLFIFTFGMGTAGASLATAISQFVSFIILLIMCNCRKDTIHIRFANFRPTAELYRRILYNGFPSLGRQGITSVATILLNNIAGGLGGDAAIAAMSIVTRYAMFINSSVIGFGQGFQPVCGFCYGAGRYDRVREAYGFCVRVVTIILIVLAAVSLIFAGPIVTVFRRDDAEVIRIGTTALRAQMLAMPFWGTTIISSMLTQSIGDGLRSTLISVARQGIFLIPMLLILPPILGLFGLQIAQPICDVLSFGFAILLTRSCLRKLDKGKVPASANEN